MINSNRIQNINHESLTFNNKRYPHGGVPLTGDLLKLMDAIDSKILRFADELSAEDHKYSCFIHSQELKKLDYLHSFPQHATFPATLSDKPVNLKKFRAKEIIDVSGDVGLEELSPTQNLLTPAACYHLYIDYQDIDLNAPLYLTTKNSCFRREKYYKPLERQWNFTMRELVYIGDKKDVDNFLDIITDKLNILFSKLNLPVAWENATDPFFDPTNNPKYITQKLAPNKWEMQYNNRLAIGSRNNHRSYFGEIFNITKDSEFAHSACVAFGLERWIAAFIETYGATKNDWPMSVLEE